jgi:pimeloyl-ACP methyl ester carboxylesterase
MVSQTRSVLNQYSDKGGTFEEIVINDAGHSPQIEKPEAFCEAVRKFINSMEKS